MDGVSSSSTASALVQQSAPQHTAPAPAPQPAPQQAETRSAAPEGNKGKNVDVYA